MTLRVALGEYDTGWHDTATSLDRAGSVVRQAASNGADLVMLPETCTTGFTMETAKFAESLEGSAASRLSEMARDAKVWLLAGLAVRVPDGDRAYNVAALYDRAGCLTTAYCKQKLFGFGGEVGPYAAGDAPVVTTIEGVRVATFICYDLRFPELFRPIARDVDAILLIANWPSARRAHWDVLTRARAIENQCYVVAVNRTGDGGGLHYDGGSVAYDPWGDALVPNDNIVALDPARVESVRKRFPFLP